MKKGDKNKDSKKQSNTIYYMIIILLSFLIYGNTLFNEFTYDDFHTIVNNERVHQGISEIPSFFYDPVVSVNKPRPIYRPIPYVTHAIEYQLFGLSPKIGHFMNIMFFILCGIVLFLFLKRLLPNYHPVFPFLMTIVFIAHPIHTESIANIKGRDDLLAFIGGVLSLLFALKYTSQRSCRDLIMSSLTLLVAIYSKENVVTLLALIPLSCYWISSDNLGRSIQKNWILYTVLLSVVVFFFVLRFSVWEVNFDSIYNVKDNPILNANGLNEKISTILNVWGLAIYKMFFPYPLLYHYGLNYIPITNFFDYKVWLSCTLLIGICSIVLKFIWKKNLFAYAIALFLITFSVYGHLFLGVTIFNERYLFFPSIAVGVILIQGIIQLLRVNTAKKLAFNTTKDYMVWGGLGLVLIVYCSLTFTRNQDWKNNFSLFSSDIKYLENNVMANFDYSLTLMKRNPEKYKDKVLSHRRKLVQLHPSSFSYRALGEAYMNYRLNDKAKECFLEALKINPNNNRANWGVGLIYYRQKDFNNAIKYLEILKNTNYVEPSKYIYLARAYASNVNATTSDLEKGIAVLIEGEKKYPNNIVILKDLARIYKLLGKSDEVQKYYKKVKKINPDDSELDRDLNMNVK